MKWAGKAKTHVVKHKEAYITGTVCFISGVAIAVIYNKKQSVAEINMMRIFSPGENNVVQTVLIRRGHPGFVVKCLETGELFASQERAAEVMGIDSGNLSKHLNGKFPNVGGFTFERLGETQAA